MKASQRRIASLAGVFVAGGLLAQCGHHSAPAQPQVKVIVKPSPSPSPVYITKTVHQHLPDSCIRLLGSLKQLELLSGVVEQGSGQHLKNMSDAVTAIALGSQQTLNDLIGQENKIKDKVDTATIDYTALRETVGDQLSQCRTDSSS